MFIRELFINNFRNLNNLKITFQDKKNLVYGLNGSGKTSVLEAIYMLSTGKSFLNVKRKDTLNYNSDSFFIKLDVLNKEDKNEIKCVYKKQNNKFNVFLNNNKTNPLEVKKILFPVFFSSSGFLSFIELKQVKRKTINRLIFGVNSLYLRYILRYNKALRQKNFILKHGKELNQISVWNKILTEMGIKIMKIRNEFVDKINKELADKFNDMKFEYIPNININNLSYDNYFKILENDYDNEIFNKKSVSGIHLDDYKFYFKSNDLKYNSSGEKKLNILKFYISYINYYMKVNNDIPVFLIDDFDTSMDRFNISYITEHYPDIQIISTSVNDYNNFEYRIDINKAKES